MKILATTIALFALFLAPSNAQRTFDMDIHPDGLPNSNGIDLSEPYNDDTRNFKPTMRVFLPAGQTGKACRVVLCCPGGSYYGLALDHEGNDWAQFFNERGIALIVIKYRMPHGFSVVPASDVYEAVRITRKHAKEWNIDPQKVGIMGHSAGGHLAATVATHATESAKPNFQILLYPVITMDATYTHKDTRHNLIGDNPTTEVIKYYSNELQVRPDNPPAFIALSNDDSGVVPQNSVNYYLALQRSKVKASLHIYPSGGHGYGFNASFPWHTQLINDLSDWLQTLE